MSLRAAPRFVLVASVLALAGGEAYATRGTYPNWSTTDALLTHMVRLAPRSSIAHDALGTELLRRGKLDEAISHYRLAVENWPLTYYLPSLPKLHRNLGIGLLRAGDVQGAIEHESRALEVNPAFGQARLNLAQALALANRPDEAVPHLERLLQEQAQSAPAHALLGDLMRRRGDTASAIKHYRDAIAIAPAPTVETRLADALTASGEPTEAVRHYRSVLKLEPNNPEVLTKLGIALARSGDLDGAIAQFRAALQMSPGNPGVHFNLGLALERSGQTAEAVQEYETTVRLAPNHKAAQARWHALSTRPATSPS